MKMSTMVVLGLCVWGMGYQGAAAPVPVASEISEVTVYADRARVTRQASCTLTGGQQVLVFEKLPGWVDEESVRLALKPAAAGSIGDVRIQREYLAKTDDQALDQAQAAVQEISDRMRALDDERRILEAEARQIENIKVFSTEKLPKDAALAQVNVEEYAKVVGFVGERSRDLAAQRRELDIARRELGPEQSARQKALNDLRSRSSLEQTMVFVTLDAPVKAKVSLSLTYMLPGATWTPVHEVRAENKEPESLVLHSHAMLTQATGEDWRNADISFSTQSSTKTMGIPELDAMLLGNTRALAQVMGGKSSSFSRAQKVFEGQQAMWNNYNNPQELIDDLKSNRTRQRRQEERATRIFKTLQARGTSAHFSGQGTPIVRSDGKPVRVSIGRTELEAQTFIAAVPEVSLNAARIVNLTNTGDQPLLPGKVGLYQGGAFLGMTETDFVAEGEAFSLFLSNADEIKLERVLDRAESSLKRGRRNRMQVAFDITVENLSDRQVALRLSDRIPVSQNREIEIFRVKISPDTDPDSKGLVNWTLELEAGETRRHRIAYTIEYPPEALVQMRKARQEQGGPVQEGDLSLQVENLELLF